MKPIPLIRAAAFAPFAGLLEAAGAPVEKLWTDSHLPLGDLHDPDAAIPLFLGVRFVEAAARKEAMEHFGLLAARRTGVASLGERGRRLRRSVTLLAAIRALLESQEAWNTGARFWLVPEGAQMRLVQRASWRAVPSRQADLATLIWMLEIVSSAAGPGWMPDTIDLQSAGPCRLPPSDPLSGCEIRTDRVGISFAFPRSFLGRPLAIQTATGPGDERSAPAPFPSDFAESTRATIRTLIEARSLRIEIAAEAAGLSARSFQRRLAESGSSFSSLVSETRFVIARELLENPSLKVIDVAYAAGYTDPAHFTRAFRRWTASSPLEYRVARSGESDRRRA